MSRNGEENKIDIFFPGIWSEMKGAVASSWPDLSACLRSNQVAKFNWTSFMEDLHNKEPGKVCLAIMQGGKCQPTREWGINRTNYLVPVKVHCVLSGRDWNSAWNEIEKKLCQLSDTLIRNIYKYFQVIDGPTIDTSESNDVNQIVLKNNLHVYSGSLSCTLLAETSE